MECDESQVAIVKTNSDEKDQDGKLAERGKVLQMQKDLSEARRKIVILDEQVNMRRSREEVLVHEMDELRKSQEMNKIKFDEEQREWLRKMRVVQESKAQDADKNKAEMDLLKAEMAKLKSSLVDAERTRLILLDDNGKLKQQEAKLRCDYNELKREHNKLLSSQQTGTTSKNHALCDKSGTENIPNRSNQIELRIANNSGIAVLGLPETYSICITPVSLTQSDNSDVASLEADSDHANDSVARSVNMQESVVMNNVNTEEKMLIKELTEKLKHSDEKNKELQETLRVIDEQCEKLVPSYLELISRCEKIGRKLALSVSLFNAARQISSQRGRSDPGTEHSSAEKHDKDDGNPGLNANKRKYTSCTTTFGKRSKNDPC